VLSAVVVSMGTIGAIYSVVLEVVPQYGLREIVAKSTWTNLVNFGNAYYQANKAPADPPTIQAGLAAGSAAANQAMLNVVLDGTLNGTGLARAINVYADLALNPFNQDAWTTNRAVVPIPVDANSASPSVFDYVNSVMSRLGTLGSDSVAGSTALGAIFDYFGWATDLNPFDICNDANEIGRLANWIAQYPDAIGALLAAFATQSQANSGNKGTAFQQQFIGQALSGILDAIQGTVTEPASDATDISYRLGAIGWPSSGLPGTALEIALDSTKAFSFLQNVLLGDIFKNLMLGQNKPLLGYASVRVVPPTTTLMGMQQFSPYSVMIELVGYRSPEARQVLQAIQQRVITLNATSGLNAMLHWGLENDQLNATNIAQTPLGQPVGALAGAPTKLARFQAVRALFGGAGTANPFYGNFARRLGF
jgi:hypothetical protein